MYIEDCCFNYIRDHCIGEGCTCECHSPKQYLSKSARMLLDAKRELDRGNLSKALEKIIDELLMEEVSKWPSSSR